MTAADGEAGPLGEEIARLLAAAQAWARQQPAAAGASPGGPVTDPTGEPAGPVAGSSCRLCPVCRALDALREHQPDLHAALAPVMDTCAAGIHDQVSAVLAALVGAMGGSDTSARAGEEPEPGPGEKTAPGRVQTIHVD